MSSQKVLNPVLPSDDGAKATVRYVVCDEHTLGYISLDCQPDIVGILRASVLRGAIFSTHDEPKFITEFKMVRDAKQEDFDVYRVKTPPNFS